MLFLKGKFAGTNEQNQSQEWQHIPVIPAVGTLKQENSEFEAISGNAVSNSNVKSTGLGLNPAMECRPR